MDDLPSIPLTDEDYERFEEQIPALAERATREACEQALQSGFSGRHYAWEQRSGSDIRRGSSGNKEITSNATVHNATLFQTQMTGEKQ